MLSPLLIEESPIPLLPNLAKQLGLYDAIVLQALHDALSGKQESSFFQEKHWIQNTYAEWQEHFPFWSLGTIRRILQDLEKKQLLISFSAFDEISKTKYYTINYTALEKRVKEVVIVPREALKVSQAQASTHTPSPEPSLRTQIQEIQEKLANGSFLTVRTLARRWSMQPKTLGQWRTEGTGPVYTKLGGRIYYSLEEVEKFERAGRRRHTTGTGGLL